MRRIALALDQTNVKACEETRMVCREQIFTVADWHPSPRSYSENQTAPVNLAERELQLDIRRVITQRVSPETHFAFTEDFSSEALEVGLAESQCNGATGMLRCNVSLELTYAPFPQNSISQLAMAKNLLQP